MSTDRKLDFFYRGELSVELAKQVVELLTKNNAQIENDEIEKALNDLTKIKEGHNGEKRSAAFSFKLPTKRKDNVIDATIGFYQLEKSQIFRIGIITAAYHFRSQDKRSTFMKLWEAIYYLTKPLIGTGYVLEYSEEDERAIKNFYRSGELKDLIVRNEFTSKREIAGMPPKLYSTEALEELQRLGVAIELKQNAKKLKDDGMRDDDRL